MSVHAVRPSSVVAAAAVIGGALTAILPRHGLTIVALVIVTAAASAGLFALHANAPAMWWRSPFERGLHGKRRTATRDLDWIGSELGERRQRIAFGYALPPQVVGRMQRLIETALERAGLLADVEENGAVIRSRLSPLAYAILTADTTRRPGVLRMRAPHRREVATCVHLVLDELDRLAGAMDVGVSDHSSRA